MTMQPSPFPELTPSPMPGDAAIVSIANADRAAREGRRQALAAPQQTSLYTQVVEELVGFANEMRDELHREMPAPFMKRKLTPEQIRRRLERMTAEERLVLSRKYGARRLAEWARQHQPPHAAGGPGNGT
jgi:hypothetical protein